MKHRDFVIYVRNSVEINALVALSQDVFTPATQTEPGFTTEHLTLVYLDPASEAQRMTGDQLRASIKTVFDVAPLVEGAVNGWKEVPNLTGIATAEEEAAFAKAINGGVELRDSLHPEFEAAHRAAAGNPDTGLGNHVEGQPLSRGIVPAEDVVQADPAIAEAVANPTE